MEIAAIIQTLATSGPLSVSTLITIFIVLLLAQSGKLIGDGIRHIYDKRNRVKCIILRDNADNVIYEHISAALEHMDGERIMIVEFSNGNKNVSLIPYTYMNCVYEVYKPGKASAANTIYKMFTHLYAIFLGQLASSPHSLMAVSVHGKGEIVPSNIIELMAQRGSEQALFARIVDPRTKKMIGFASYDHNASTGFTEHEMTTMKNVAITVGAVITMKAWESLGRGGTAAVVPVK